MGGLYRGLEVGVRLGNKDEVNYPMIIITRQFIPG